MYSRRANSPDPLSRSAFESTTLIQLLSLRAINDAGTRAYTFLSDGRAALSYRELDRRSRAIAALLQSLSAAGERALLLYPPGLEFIPSLFGCMYAGVIAVPAYPPEPSRLNRSLPRLQAIITDAGAKVVLTTSSVLSHAKFLFAQAPELERLEWVATDNLDVGLEERWREVEVRADTPAFIQYTSGSTGAPKGVILSHRNLLHNARLVYEAVEHAPSDSYISWLPLFHDMGLMAGVLQPLYASLPVTLMSPIAFLQKPVRWLQSISLLKATTSGGPNFAYDLCARKISAEERAGLDLSSWTVAFNGAEPIRRETLKRFVATFEPYGFRPEAFYPCYGLAEATLIVSGGRKALPPETNSYSAAQIENNRVAPVVEGPGARTLVSCGEPLGDQSVAIVNPDSLTRCAPDEVGEICVSGPSVAVGYWGKPEQTEETFKARFSETGEGPFLRTGDLGFFHNGELYITGRLKDLIIIRGRNHYPQDIEATVERAHRAFRQGCGAAFSTETESEEGLAIVQEVDLHSAPDLNDLMRRICAAVANDHEVQVEAVALIRPGSIPKTSSGKIQRQTCRAAFLQSNLDLLAQWRREDHAAPACSMYPPPEGVENIRAWIVSQVAAHTGLSPSEIDASRPLTEYGLDSLAAIELAHSIETHTGRTLPMVSFLDGRSIEQLAGPIAADSEEGYRSTASIINPEIEQETGEHPLSFGQRALWFLQNLSPENSANNIASALRINGDLDAESLRRAFQALVDRHACLRATFPAFDGEPIQRVAERAELFFHYEDGSSWSHSRLNDRLVKEAHRPFRLDTGPLLRVNLFKLSADDHILLLAVHHIIADFWSLGVLVDELAQLYEAEKSAGPAALPPLTLQYHDYARWQMEMLAGETGERLWAYWREKLAGDLPPLALPTDRPRPRVQTYTGNSYSFKVSAETTRSLKTLAQANGATLYMTLLAAFEALLHRYTAQEEILVGSPSAGRSKAEMADVVGYFVNPLVLRTKVEPSSSFESLLATVRKDVLEAFEHQEYPFALLVERLRPCRDLSRSPVFQVMFVLQKARRSGEQGLEALALSEAGARIKLGRLTVESVRLEQRIAQFDLMLMMAEVGDSLHASLQYNSRLFDAGTIQRMAGHFRRLLEQVVANPRARISDYSLLSRFEQHQLLTEWNATGVASELRQVCIHELFQEQVKRTPDAVALVCGRKQLTYRDLNCEANQVARLLRSLGVSVESAVGIFTNRSVDMLVAILATLKAGGTYVPLDPAYPKDRLAFMLEDSGCVALLTQSRLLERLPKGAPKRLCLDLLGESIASESDRDLLSGVRPENLAYIIYTSGSTGRPKGVAIEHRSTAVLLEWAKGVFGKEDLSGMLASTSVCFDLSVFEVFFTLSRGGRVILSENALELPELAARSEVTLINTVPSAIAELLRINAIPDCVLTINLAGEPLQGAVVEGIFQQTKARRVLNLYGPSEDTTYSTFDIIERAAIKPPTIGRPITGTQVYILERSLRPAPVGVTGELYIGGAGLARGYLNRPDLTAERFIPNPFSNEPGARMYGTGDLARYLSGGDIDFLGRIDQQVKVRGFRIEPGEVEAAIRQHPRVRDAIVVAREDAAGDRQLVAYVVAEPGGRVSISELRDSLKQRLPDFMIPSAFVPLDELPMTPNGKIDRQALPPPAALRQDSDREVVEPSTLCQKVLTEIFSETLSIKKLGVDDDFFEMGGHSLLATQVISRVRERLHVDLPVRSLFETATVRGLAAELEKRQLQQVSSEKISEMLEELSGLSNEEAEALLAAEELLDEGDLQ